MGGVRLITPAAQILLALSRAETPLSFREIVDATNLPHATVDLNLKRLLVEGLVERVGGRYRLSPQGRARVESLIVEVAGRG